MSYLESTLLEQDTDYIAKLTLRHAVKLYHQNKRDCILFLQKLGFSEETIGRFLELCRKNGEKEA